MIDRDTYHVTLQVASYIAHPYWPERERVINITKESGMNRARSSANRRKALEEHLKSIGMTLGEYDDLNRLADRPFYTDADGRIIIPELHVTSMIVATCDTMRSSGRPCPPDVVRSAMKVSDFATPKRDPDGVWERFAVVSAGTGAKLSNQRALRRNEYIEDFEARGTIALAPDFVRPDVLHKALVWAGQFIGLGASRKMGWGRFEITGFAKR